MIGPNIVYHSGVKSLTLKGQFIYIYIYRALSQIFLDLLARYVYLLKLLENEGETRAGEPAPS